MAKARTELIHCENCGEDYAATYRRCPFCNAKRSGGREESEVYDYSDEDYDTSHHRGGKRLAGGQGPGGRSVGEWVKLALYILSALVILAAIIIMVTFVIPKLLPARPSAEPSPSPSPSGNVAVVPPTPSVEPTLSAQLPVVDDDPLSLDSPDLPTVAPDPISTQTPVATAAPVTPAPNAALKLSSTDFTLSPKYPTYQMEITGVGRAQATYSMSNESVATVSSTGLITAVSNGNTTLTVTDQNGNKATAIVRVSGMSAASTPAPTSAASTPSTSSTSSGSAKLNYSDFSITAQYPDPIRLRVQGGEATGWKSSNTGVATVSDNGTVSGVGNGYAKITCTLSDGSTLTCDVHVSGK